MPPSTDALDGRLLAQRKVLARLLMRLGDADLRAFLEERAQISAQETRPTRPGLPPKPPPQAEEMHAILTERTLSGR